MKKFENDEFENILKMQESLNKKFNGEDWEDVVSSNNLKFAVFTEVAELMESKPSKWKWWKPYESDDEQNAYIELIDIMHFSLCYLLLHDSVKNLIRENESLPVYIDFTNDVIEEIHFFFKNPTVEYFYCFLDCLLKTFDLSQSKVISVYNSKNKLNHERVEKGYIEGSYNKVNENGEEDNRRIDI